MTQVPDHVESHDTEAIDAQRRRAARVLFARLIANGLIQCFLVVRRYLGMRAADPIAGLLFAIVPVGLGIALFQGRRWALWVLIVLFTMQAAVQVEMLHFLLEWVHVFGAGNLFEPVFLINGLIAGAILVFYAGGVVWLLWNRRALYLPIDNKTAPGRHCVNCGEDYDGERCPMCGETA